MPPVLNQPAATPRHSADRITCRLCTIPLGLEEDDNFEHRLCGSCLARPEAQRLGLPAGVLPAAAEKRRPDPVSIPARPKTPAARAFTPAEQGLIAKMHGLMPAQALLDLLNERLAFDLGEDAVAYPMEQLMAEISRIGGVTRSSDGGWTGLRKMLAQARRSGLLDKIDEQALNDFAVVFRLTPRQLVQLKDIVLSAKEAAR